MFLLYHVPALAVAQSVLFDWLLEGIYSQHDQPELSVCHLISSTQSVCNLKDIIQTVPPPVAVSTVRYNLIGLVVKQVLLFFPQGISCHVKECSSHGCVEQQFIIPDRDDPLFTT